MTNADLGYGDPREVEAAARSRPETAGDNGAVATNASVAFGFNGSWTGSNPAPTSFTLNGTVCTGGVNPTTGPPTSAPPTGSLPSTFRWRSSGQLIGPKSDATHNIRGQGPLGGVPQWTVARVCQYHQTRAAPTAWCT